jgi:uncharacterized membrane protein
VSVRLSSTRRGSWRVVVVVAIVGLVIVIPTAQFAGRVGRDLAGDAGYYFGMTLAIAAVVVAAALAARVVTALYGTAPAAPPADPTPEVVAPTPAADPAPPAG